MTAPLKPFWRYYGGKWRAVHAGLYPQPVHRHIIEPFAGAAGYAMHYPHLAVTLIERDPCIAGIWRWLISAKSDEVRSIPLVDDVADLPEWVPLGARDLIGFSMNAATSSPRKALSAGARKLRESGRKFYGWTHEQRERVAAQVPSIKHWSICEGDYASVCAPAAGRWVGRFDEHAATWFVDPPYECAGSHYKYGPSGISYGYLGAWCRERNGQVIVCEAQGATWLPFRKIGLIKSGPRSRGSAEAVWP